jgi:hypothetical protein
MFCFVSVNCVLSSWICVLVLCCCVTVVFVWSDRQTDRQLLPAHVVTTLLLDIAHLLVLLWRHVLQTLHTTALSLLPLFRTILAGLFVALCIILTMFTRPHSCVLPQARSVHPTSLYSVYLAFISISSSHLRLGLPSDKFLKRFPFNITDFGNFGVFMTFIVQFTTWHLVRSIHMFRNL